MAHGKAVKAYRCNWESKRLEDVPTGDRLPNAVQLANAIFPFTNQLDLWNY